MTARIHNNSSENASGSSSQLVKMRDALEKSLSFTKHYVTDAVLHVAYAMGLGYSKDSDSFKAYSIKLLREAIVNEQTLQHAQQTGPYSLFPAIINGDLEALKEVFQQDPLTHKKILKYDAAGANIVHIAYLYQQYDIGHFLVERFPRLALEPYRGEIARCVHERLKNFDFEKLKNENLMPYTGENILHMTIVRRNYKEVRWLLDFYRDHKDFFIPAKKVASNSAVNYQSSFIPPEMLGNNTRFPDGSGSEAVGMQQKVVSLKSLHSASVAPLSSCEQENQTQPYIDALAKLLTANAYGNFFDPKGGFYFGGYPLQFAVCSNDTEIFDLVFAFVAMIGGNVSDTSTGDGDAAGKSETSSNMATSQNSIFERDVYGNTVLHLCVLHGLKEMYAHVYKTALSITTRELKIVYATYSSEKRQKVKRVTLQSDEINGDNNVDDNCGAEGNAVKYGYAVKPAQVVIPLKDKYHLWLKEEAKRIVDERLVHALNEELHSPLTLAASLIRKGECSKEKLDNRVEMFKFLLGHCKQQLWQYGPVGLSHLDLEGVEIKYRLTDRYDLRGREDKVKGIEMHAAVDWLCINDADAAVQLPMIRKLIETKWERVGYPMFLVGFVIHSIITLLVTLVLIFVNASPTRYPTHSTEWVVNILYPIVAIIFFTMFCMECNDVIVMKAYFWKFRSIARFNKVCRVLKIFSFLAFCIAKGITADRGRLDEDNSVHGATVYYDNNDNIAIKFFLTVCVITAWMHLYFFFMGFDTTGPFILTMFRIVARDVPYFLNFYAIVVIAFGSALSVLSNDGNFRAGYGFMHLIKAIWTLVQNTVDLDPTQDRISMDFVPVGLQWWADILLTMYYMSVVILMLNLLIAMISATYELYTGYNDAILLIEKYNIMHAMEKALTPQELKENRAKYHANIMESDPESRYTEFKAENENAIDWVEEECDDEYCMTSAVDTVRIVSSSHSSDVKQSSVVPTTTSDIRSGAGGTCDVTAVNTLANAGSAVRNLPSKNKSGDGPRRFSLLQQSSAKFIPQQSRRSSNIMEKREARMLTKFEISSLNEAWWSLEEVEKDETAASLSFNLEEAFVDGTKKTTLFIIDPQNDFHPEGGDKKLGTYHAPGSLAVAGANEDTDRIATMIDRYGHYIHQIFVSMDSHYPCHIAHAVSWRNKEGRQPEPFTSITYNDIKKGIWKHVDDDPETREWCLFYTAQLERKKKQVLTIWPEHCIVGSAGHGVVPVLNEALQRWAKQSGRPVHYIMKGQNLRTEMYSALEAEVEDPKDPSTALNNQLISMLRVSDRLLICGQAMSHCVNYTTRDIMNHWDGDLSELVLLTDSASPVWRCERIAEEFVQNAKERGVTLSTTATIFSHNCYEPATPEEAAAPLPAAADEEKQGSPELSVDSV